jgi:putative Holliday junction resolvase
MEPNKVNMTAANRTILALDIGSARIGMALANTQAKLATPAGTLENNQSAVKQLQEFCAQEAVEHLIIGLPRGLNGQDTTQTDAVRAMGTELAKQLALPFSWQDEAVTSAKAEAELKARGKAYAKEEIDALAATYILEDYLHEQP